MSKDKRYSPYFLVPACFIVSWALFSFFPGLLETWHLKAGDSLFKLRQSCFGNQRISPAVVHLDIDDASVKALGPHVESAARYETIMKTLSSVNAGAIAFDLIMLTASDGMIAATRESGRVYYPVAVGHGHAAIPESQLWHPSIRRPCAAKPQGVTFMTCHELVSVARGIGHITCLPDSDGVYRRFPLLLPVEKGYVPALSFRIVCDYLKVTPERVEIDAGSAITLRGAEFPDGRKKDIRIPVDAECRLLVNFAGYETNSFPHFSLARLTETAKDSNGLQQLRDQFDESIVVVADISTARDLGAVPMERTFHMPGLHSNVVSSILTGQFVRELPAGASFGLDLIFVLILVFVAIRTRSARGFVFAAAAILIAFVILYISLFLYGGILANGVRTGLGMALCLVALTVQKYIAEEKDRAFLRARFENYFAPELLDKILASKTALDACEKKTITILFSDIAGFTSWSADRSPEEIRNMLNEYFKIMTGIVFKHGGTVDKYFGDGLMVFFGDPMPQEDHALRAVSAAIEMQRKAKELGARWRAEGRMDLRIRIGINTGLAVVGNLGTESRVDYTAIGANVNLAQRLESNAPVGGILVSRPVYEQAGNVIAMKPAGRIKVKGFDNEIEVFEVAIENVSGAKQQSEC